MDYIEFTGVPGSGKTTLSNRFVKNNPNYLGGQSGRETCILRAINLPSLDQFPRGVIKPVLDRIWSHSIRGKSLSLFMRNRPSAVQAMLQVSQSMPRSTERYIWLYQDAAAEYQLFESYAPPQTMVMDESLAHYGASALSAGENGRRYLNTIPCPDILVFVDAPSEICLDRQDSRSKPRSSLVTDIDRRTALGRIEDQQRLVNLSVDHLSERGANVIRIETGDRSIDECIQSLQQQLDVQS